MSNPGHAADRPFDHLSLSLPDWRGALSRARRRMRPPYGPYYYVATAMMVTSVLGCVDRVFDVAADRRASDALLAVANGIFAVYWRAERRDAKRGRPWMMRGPQSQLVPYGTFFWVAYLLTSLG